MPHVNIIIMHLGKSGKGCNNMTGVCINLSGLNNEAMFHFHFFYMGTHGIGARDLVAASEWWGGGTHVILTNAETGLMPVQVTNAWP